MSTERIAKIKSTHLGVEGHGIWTAMLTVDYGGSSQSIGGYCLDEPTFDEDEKFIERRGTAFGMEWIKRVVEACGANDPTWVLVRSTGRRPWTVRRERRARNKVARASRKANRR